MRHANVAIFIPHIGCPGRCSFCNQNTISGEMCAPTPDEVTKICAKALGDLGERAADSEIAFFGGSFTAIDRSYMTALLDAAGRFVGGGGFYGIRISTRPDYIDDEVLTLLRAKGVTAIELGAQSMDDSVLFKNRRGHTAQDVVTASEKIKRCGFSLGVQMMTGLYGDTPRGSLETAKKLADLGPETARVYPTVVLQGTYLCELMKSGRYRPLGLEDTVRLCCDILDVFDKAGVRVIRLGLHANESIERTMAGGAYHPALRQLCESERVYRAILKQCGAAKNITIVCNPRKLSEVLGQKRCNIDKLQNQGIHATVVTDDSNGTFTVIKAEE